MDSLKDFQKDLNKCSKCGLCETVCPLFKINPNDCVASKGKFIMLHGVTKGDLKLSKNINKYIDTCLKCGKCNSFCPSGIDVCKILNTAKHEYMKKTFSGKIINFAQQQWILQTFIRIAETFSNLFRPKKEQFKTPVCNIVYFKGCVNRVFPQTDKYLNKIIKNLPLNIIEPDFDCCGLPFLSEGNLERFIQAAQCNIKKLKNINYDFLVTDCASCESTILDYSKYLDSPVQTSKSINWGDLIARKGLTFKYNKPIKVTFHKPCHLKNDAFLRQIMKNCENVEYIEMEDYDACCGIAGSFALKNPKYSQKLSVSKANHINNTNADYVITTCPACIIGLKQGLHLTKGKTKVISLLEFLSKADKISLQISSLT